MVTGKYGGMSILSVVVAASAITMTTASDPLMMKSDLFYSTPSACERLATLPSHHLLVGELLPEASFHGNADITLSPQSGDCVVHVAVSGVLDTLQDEDVFSLSSTVDHQLSSLAQTQYLRGSERSSGLTLYRIHVGINKREYVMALQTTASVEKPTNKLSMNGAQCDPLRGEGLMKEIFSEASAVGNLHIDSNHDQSVEKCAVDLDITSVAPSFSSNSDAFAYLKSIDDKLNEHFGTTPSNAQKNSSLMSLLTANLKFTAASTSGKQLATSNFSTSINAPTKTVTLGILFGLTVLMAMFITVVHQKKRHDQNCQDRHANASKAAQIRRVSYRMSNGHFGDAYEEEKDGLL